MRRRLVWIQGVEQDLPQWSFSVQWLSTVEMLLPGSGSVNGYLEILIPADAELISVQSVSLTAGASIAGLDITVFDPITLTFPDLHTESYKRYSFQRNATANAPQDASGLYFETTLWRFAGPSFRCAERCYLQNPSAATSNFLSTRSQEFVMNVGANAEYRPSVPDWRWVWSGFSSDPLASLPTHGSTTKNQGAAVGENIALAEFPYTFFNATLAPPP